MKFHFLPFILLSGILFAACSGTTPQYHLVYDWKVDSVKSDFAKYVDPMIGTAGHGHTFPGATAPFGMVQLSPDTRIDGSWDGCSGYHYDDDTIYGFSHTHLSGTGCSDYGDILFMPGRETDKDFLKNSSSGFSHANEKASAGYYSVVLDNFKTKAELTASPRVGVHRYTFENDGHNAILVDLVHRDEVLDSHIEIVNDRTIKGYRFSKAWANDQRVYFYAEFSRPFEKSVVYDKNKAVNADSLTSKSIKAVFSFGEDGETIHQVIVKVALSAVSCENAKMNMETEVPDFDFDAVLKKVLQQWNSELGKIEVKSGDETKKKIFYTALYHCFIAPNLYCDVNGDYRGRDNKIHTDTIHPQYTVFSLWDTYRALHPLFTIIQPKRDQDFINTFVKQAQQGDRLPVWELSANETDCMIGYHSVPVIVDAWMKGLTDFDTATAYEAMVSDAMQDDRGLEAYKKFGFIPAEGESESVSKTLEYAYDDWCIALAAKRMKREDDYEYFMRRSQSWRNLYDPETGFFRPRLNNSFVEPFDPAEVNFHLTEANAWQYSLAVQQDIPGLIKAHGGDAKFIQHLDSLFSVSSATSGREQADISGLIGQYAQGNEPSHHMAYLYDYTSQPWKTQELVSKICNEMYTDKPDGLCGNEDCGQMSAWYVMSMMGIYQVTPGTKNFCLGSPQFDEVILHLENGKQFVIVAQNAGKSKPYIESWHGVEDAAGIYANFNYDEIMKGGGANFEMTGFPIINYGIPEFPENDSVIIPAVPIVWIAAASDKIHTDILPTDRTFSKQISLVLRYNNLGHYKQEKYYPGKKFEYAQKIFVSVNGSPFYDNSDGYLDLYETSTVRTFSKDEWGHCSDTIEFRYTKVEGERHIKLNSAYASQYSAGGDYALIDGIRGADNFRTGDWQGYEGKDMDVVIDLGSVKEVNHIAAGFLQDQDAWIFFPSEVVFYSSVDGKNFTEIETAKNTYKQDSQTVLLNDLYTSKKTKARYIKVLAKNPGPCPQWHPGRGNPSWIFSDEIIIN